MSEAGLLFFSMTTRFRTRRVRRSRTASQSGRRRTRTRTGFGSLADVATPRRASRPTSRRTRVTRNTGRTRRGLTSTSAARRARTRTRPIGGALGRARGLWSRMGNALRRGESGLPFPVDLPAIPFLGVPGQSSASVPAASAPPVPTLGPAPYPEEDLYGMAPIPLAVPQPAFPISEGTPELPASTAVSVAWLEWALAQLIRLIKELS